MEQDSTAEKKEKIRRLLSNKYFLSILFILLFAFVIRIYFFSQTTQQAVWWDEAEYLSTAKKFAFSVPYELNPQRPPLYQFLIAVLFWLGFGELSVKFLLTLLPSVLLVFCVYLLGVEMFDKKTALIAAFFTAISWTFLFWSVRAQPDFLSVSFQVLSIAFMWRFWKSQSSRFAVWAGIFSAIGFLFKVSGLLVPLSFMAFIFIKDRFSALKNKHYYYYALAFILTLLPYFIWSQANFGTPFAFKYGYSNALISSTPVPFGWYNLDFFYTLTENILFILFILGLILAMQFLLYLDILVKDKKRCFDPLLFSIIILLIVSAFYIFYIRGTEDRWVYLWMPFIFLLAGKGLLFVYEKANAYNKPLAISAILLIVFYISFTQLSHANELIKVKEPSYMPVKEAGLWLKENANKSDTVLSASYTQTVYYSELNVTHLNTPNFPSQEDFDIYLNNTKTRFLIVSGFEYHPPWVYTWPQQNQFRTAVAQAYFADAENKQPLLIIYEILYN